MSTPSSKRLPPPRISDESDFYQAIRALPGSIVGKVKFVQATSCWQWIGALGQNGYPRVWDGQKAAQASRVTYEALLFELKPGIELGPLCRNKLCINPAHMERGTRSDTVKRGTAWLKAAELMRTRTHCPQGHPYDDANTSRRTDGRRACRACNRARWVQRKQAMSIARRTA